MIEIQIKLKELMPKNQGRSFNGSSHGKKLKELARGKEKES